MWFYCSLLVARAERWASGAANGRSEGRAEAIDGRLQAIVGRGRGKGLYAAVWPHTSRSGVPLRLGPSQPVSPCHPEERAQGLK